MTDSVTAALPPRQWLVSVVTSQSRQWLVSVVTSQSLQLQCLPGPGCRRRSSGLPTHSVTHTTLSRAWVQPTVQPGCTDSARDWNSVLPADESATEPWPPCQSKLKKRTNDWANQSNWISTADGNAFTWKVICPVKLQALVYDILLSSDPSTAIIGDAIALTESRRKRLSLS